MSTPMTTISVCSNVFTDSSYKHVLYFTDDDERETYFRSKTVRQFTAYSYCRKSWSIKVEAPIYEARHWTYLYFVNAPDLKPYYYFITRVEYINDSTVELFLELDVMQTYHYGENLKPCFIERQTPRTDDIGDNTVDEGLELGELTVSAQTEFDELEKYCALIMATVFVPDTGTPLTAYGWEINGVPTGVGIYVTTVERISEIITDYETAGKFDSIMSIWLYPRALVDIGDVEWDELRLAEVKALNEREFYVNMIDCLRNYEPRNNKLLTYPYNFLYVTNNLGTSANYRFERFGSLSEIFFEIVGSPFPDGGVKLVPRNYNGVGFNHDEGLTLSSYPTCAFSGDYYKIWLAQNQNQQNAAAVGNALTIVGGVGAIAAGAVSMNPMAIGGGLMTLGAGAANVYSQIAAHEDMKVQPPQARGGQSASVNAVNSKHTFTFYTKCVSPERAKIIDDYFTMYGYKVNQVGVPDLSARKRFTYVKTIGCLASDNIPPEDKVKIEQIYDAGVTLWRDIENVGNYTPFNYFWE